MTSTTLGTFAHHAERYRAAGWFGTLPLPANAKYPPPGGFTGGSGGWPTDQDISAWGARFGDSFNLALRLPEDVIGVDIDAYGDKPGATTLAEAEARWGTLPATYTSTARADGVSGIRIYRVPAGLAWNEEVGPAVEVIQYGHRYMVAAPSTNPKTGTAYRWTTPQGLPVDVPILAEIPALPDAWVAGLTRGPLADERRRRVGVDVDAWLADLPDGPPCADVEEALDRARLALSGGGSRYDAAVHGTMALVGRGRGGCSGVAGALLTLRAEYEDAVAGESRDPREWDRSFRGAVEKTAGQRVEFHERCIEHQARMLVFDYTPPSLWDERPILRHLHDFARGRRVAPLAVLGVTLARVVAATPSNIVLPPIIGGDGTLNLFVALVGDSGAGKGSAEAAAAEAIDISALTDRISGEPVRTVNVGSGEGFAHMFVTRRQGELVRIRDSVLFSVPEVDTLSALGARQGATLMPVLRSAWSGERIGFSYADPTKALDIEPRSYRCALLLGVQPAKAGPLLGDAEGGTPQRFLWVRAADKGILKNPPPPPTPVVWDRKYPTVPRYEMAVTREAVDEIGDAHWRRSRGEGDALDGHALYTRLKVAAALALLDRRLDVTSDDWRLSGRIMALSDRTRAGVVADLRERASKANIGRAKAEAARAVVVAEAVDAQAIQRASRAVKTALGKNPGGWMSAGELRRAVPSRVRRDLDDALDALGLSGDIDTEAITYRGQQGTRYRLRG
ncbi:DNA primase/helicase, phage-associated [Actinokineospora spheciospongiae]|uniref:DNA primase/helicase, phage-associated n=1 Tax=Actinokineospora spheciospongiae TaxID=909613 RepID=W7J776_9PSEU|nr:bifunctional DNA primase/polymerase [Actinokineospora spheciospongiae]EWC61904.1 DNA primase/helicase, phage-associated [Actinokineospora spheciospongiae]